MVSGWPSPAGCRGSVGSPPGPRRPPPAAAPRSRGRPAAASRTSRRGRGPSRRRSPWPRAIAETPPGCIVVDDVHLEVDRADAPPRSPPARPGSSLGRRARRGGDCPAQPPPRRSAETPPRRIGDGDPPSGWRRPACAGDAASPYRSPVVHDRRQPDLHSQLRTVPSSQSAMTLLSCARHVQPLA